MGRGLIQRGWLCSRKTEMEVIAGAIKFTETFTDGFLSGNQNEDSSEAETKGMSAWEIHSISSSGI